MASARMVTRVAAASINRAPAVTKGNCCYSEGEGEGRREREESERETDRQTEREREKENKGRN